jgi:peptidyl-prolyl cis-trans isomerase C
MNRVSLIAAAVATALAMGGCTPQNDAGTTTTAQSLNAPPAGAPPAPAPAAPKIAPENMIATVNGKPITRTELQVLTAEIQQRGGNNIPEEKIVEGLIAHELMRQEAAKAHLDKDPQVAARLENAAREVLFQSALDNYRKNLTISDEDLKKEYDTRVGSVKMTEYKARHILLDSEDEAKKALAELKKKGAKFEEIAKKLSKDPSAKQNSGELGWFNPKQMVPEFSSAVAAMQNGEIGQTPVKSQFGWHVIQREDAREQTPPAFDDVKEQIRSILQSQKLQQHIQDLKAAAKIDRPTPPPPPKAEAPAEPKSEAAPAAPETPAAPAQGEQAPAKAETPPPASSAPAQPSAQPEAKEVAPQEAAPATPSAGESSPAPANKEAGKPVPPAPAKE